MKRKGRPPGTVAKPYVRFYKGKYVASSREANWKLTYLGRHDTKEQALAAIARYHQTGEKPARLRVGRPRGSARATRKAITAAPARLVPVREPEDQQRINRMKQVWQQLGGNVRTKLREEEFGA